VRTDALTNVPALTDVPALAARMALLSGEGALDVFRRATALERAGRTVVHLELGAPDVDAPAHVVEAAVAALRAGDARYVAPQGLVELREAIAEDVRSRGVAADADQVIVTPSAKTAVCYAMLATVEPGSEVLVPDPGFPIYPSMARFAGGVPVGYALDAGNAPTWTTSPGASARARACCASTRPTTRPAARSTRPRRRGSPSSWRATTCASSPTTSTRASSSTARARRPSPRTRAPPRARCSSTASQDVRDDRLPARLPRGGRARGSIRSSRWRSTVTPCVPPFVQRAGVAALTGPQDVVAAQVAAYRARRDRLVRGLAALPGVRCPTPAGAFYVFPDFSALLAPRGLTSRDLAHRLLETHGVAAIDGAAFGARGEGRLRFSFASAQADLDAALAGVGEAVAALA
jgi:aspartate/methionine/tyrosine aminotransferase